MSIHEHMLKDIVTVASIFYTIVKILQDDLDKLKEQSNRRLSSGKVTKASIGTTSQIRQMASNDRG